MGTKALLYVAILYTACTLVTCWQQSLGSIRLTTRRSGVRQSELYSLHAKVQYPVSREKTWSNPSGKTLTPVTNHVWAAERPFIWNKIDVGGKMGVVKLQDGSLWVHSPVAIDEDLLEELQALGPVRHMVSPNYEHVKWARDWVQAFPEGTAWACPGLGDLKPDVGFQGTIGLPGSSLPESWLGEFEVCFLDFEHNPFTKKAFFNEVLFFHKPSKVLLVTDAFWNYPSNDNVPALTKLWKFGMDQVYLPFYRNFMIKDSKRFEEAVGEVLRWDFQTILPCHGGFISGAEVSKQAISDHLLQGKIFSV